MPVQAKPPRLSVNKLGEYMTARINRESAESENTEWGAAGGCPGLRLPILAGGFESRQLHRSVYRQPLHAARLHASGHLGHPIDHELAFRRRINHAAVEGPDLFRSVPHGVDGVVLLVVKHRQYLASQLINLIRV